MLECLAVHRREMEKKKQEAVDREQELAATKIQSRIRGKQARREQCSEAGLSRLKPTCALYFAVSRIVLTKTFKTFCRRVGWVLSSCEI